MALKRLNVGGIDIVALVGRLVMTEASRVRHGALAAVVPGGAAPCKFGSPFPD